MENNDPFKPLWTLEQGISLARRLELIAIAHNAHVALGGSVLHSGYSDKDVDIFIYPHKTTVPVYGERLMEAFGATEIEQRPHEYQNDDKIVFKAEVAGKRVDFFFVK